MQNPDFAGKAMQFFELYEEGGASIKRAKSMHMYTMYTCYNVFVNI